MKGGWTFYPYFGYWEHETFYDLINCHINTDLIDYKTYTVDEFDEFNGTDCQSAYLLGGELGKQGYHAFLKRF